MGDSGAKMLLERRNFAEPHKIIKFQPQANDLRLAFSVSVWNSLLFLATKE